MNRLSNRNTIHQLVSLGMWLMFAYYWYLVGRHQINRASFNAVGLLVAITVSEVLLTLWWVRHNKKLARRNRREHAPTSPPETFAQDKLGRPLRSPVLSVLKQARLVDIELSENGEKIYTIGNRVAS